MYYRKEGDFLDGLQTLGTGEGRETAGKGKGIEDGKREIRTCCSPADSLVSVPACKYTHAHIYLLWMDTST